MQGVRRVIEAKLDAAAKRICDLDWGCGCCSHSSDAELGDAIKVILRELLDQHKGGHRCQNARSQPT